MNVAAIYEDGESLGAPRPMYNEGDTFYPHTNVDVWVDGYEQSRYITSAEVLEVDVELVVEEMDWYILYRLSLFEEGEFLTTELFTPTEIKKLDEDVL